MEKWEKFEINSCAYLNNYIKINNGNFVRTGASDSNSPDIIYKYNIKGELIDLLSIEAKYSPSQSGQFVVNIKDGEFIYSGVDPINKYSKAIIEIMNKNNNKFQNVSSKAIPIDCSPEISMGWIKKHYKLMKVDYIITSSCFEDFDNNFIRIIPIDQIGHFFSVQCNYRRKKSGSRKLPISDRERARKLIKNAYGDKIEFIDEATVQFSNEKPDSNYFGDCYYLSGQYPKYVIRKLSGTNNPNIIFSLKYNESRSTEGFDDLLRDIKDRINRTDVGHLIIK